MNFRIFPALLAVCLSFPSTLRAQSREQGLTVEILAVSLHDGQAPVILVSGENAKEVSEPFELPVYQLSEAIEVKSRTFFLYPEKAVLDGKTPPVATVRIPGKGSDFRVILIPAAKGKYQPTVIRADGPGFRSGDVFVLNLARKEIVANLGSDAFAVKPGGNHMARLSGAVDNSYYPVLIGSRAEGKVKPITETRWPVMRNNRSYMIFFQQDPNTITYRGVDEFLPPGE